METKNQVKVEIVEKRVPWFNPKEAHNKIQNKKTQLKAWKGARPNTYSLQ